MSLQTERSMELRKSIRRFADENPELAAQMIKVWLRGGEDGG
jgi:flagellar M-ring protein FliF